MQQRLAFLDMRLVLHIVCDPKNPLAEELRDRQREQANLEVRVFQFGATESDYKKLLDEVFEADSIEVC